MAHAPFLVVHVCNMEKMWSPEDGIASFHVTVQYVVFGLCAASVQSACMNQH